MSTTTDSSVKPTVIVGADSRFATTFLSTKYRDKAVHGEALMDKASGELYIKRASDGKIVSFYQNKKMTNDIALEFRVLLTNNGGFLYPKNTESAYYVSTNYDLISINNESIYNLLTDNVTITGAPDNINKLIFKVSGNSNGFFCRNATRDIDKAIIEFLTNQYNTLFKNYDGSTEEYLAEKDKFNNMKWEYSNAVLTYDLTITKDGEDHIYTDIVDYIRINEDSCVLFPTDIINELESFDYSTVSIKSITYDKIHFMVNHKDEFGAIFTEAYNKLSYNDNKIEVAEFNIIHFIDEANQFEILGNENNIAFLDMARLNHYMNAMNNSDGAASSLVISGTQPLFACTWFKPNE